jgi:transcriptional regulator with XRE-family HTH domain
MGWSSAELAKRAGLTRNTVDRVEKFDSVPAGRTETVARIAKVFQEAGIEFLGLPEHGPGVRFWHRLERKP